MADGTDGRERAQREYRFFAGGREVDLAAFLEAVARRGEACQQACLVEAVDEPAYTLTAKGRRALRGEVA